MIQLAVVGQEHFRVDEIERELLPPSYTLQTVDALEQRHPNHQFALILGGDSVRDLPNWHEPGPLVSRVEIVAGARPGAETWSAFQLAEALRVSEQTIRLQWVPIPQIELASRELRQRVQAGQSIRFAVPRPVEEFIRERQLYQQDTHESR
jgi:nicotinate-nucleotide adenylyltransferase